MAQITLGGNPISTSGELPAVGSKAPEFTLVNEDFENINLSTFKGSKVILNIFPSIATGICAASVRRFNADAANLDNTRVLCISKDLPFAQKSFCASEGIEGVINLSDLRNGDFGKDYGVVISSGKWDGLHSRAVVVVDEEGKVVYTEQIPEIAQEPNYEAALAAVK
jgi:thiol peroxidase